MRRLAGLLPSLALSAALAAVCASGARAQLLGPLPGPNTPYLQFSDSPFFGGSFSYFYLENFETHALTVPGVTPDAGGVTSIVFGPAIHDSVDADDGVIDGSGLNGDDWFANGSTGVTWTFNAGVLGSLPDHAGIVWTDGAGSTTFQAWDQNGVSLGTITYTSDDGRFDGTTADDRFYGAINAGGISKIHLSNQSGGIEMDHLQYGLASTTQGVPEPGTLAFGIGAGMALVGILRKRRAG